MLPKGGSWDGGNNENRQPWDIGFQYLSRVVSSSAVAPVPVTLALHRLSSRPLFCQSGGHLTSTLFFERSFTVNGHLAPTSSPLAQGKSLNSTPSPPPFVWPSWFGASAGLPFWVFPVSQAHWVMPVLPT